MTDTREVRFAFTNSAVDALDGLAELDAIGAPAFAKIIETLWPVVRDIVNDVEEDARRDGFAQAQGATARVSFEEGWRAAALLGDDLPNLPSQTYTNAFGPDVPIEPKIVELEVEAPADDEDCPLCKSGPPIDREVYAIGEILNSLEEHDNDTVLRIFGYIALRRGL